MNPALYMLPPDFTPATLGGFKLGAAEDPTMMTVAAGALHRYGQQQLRHAESPGGRARLQGHE